MNGKIKMNFNIRYKPVLCTWLIIWAIQFLEFGRDALGSYCLRGILKNDKVHVGFQKAVFKRSLSFSI